MNNQLTKNQISGIEKIRESMYVQKGINCKNKIENDLKLQVIFIGNDPDAPWDDNLAGTLIIYRILERKPGTTGPKCTVTVISPENEIENESPDSAVLNWLNH